MNLYVGNLPYSVTEDELRRLFGEVGEVQTVNIIIDRDTNRPKGFAFVQMANQQDGQSAIDKLNGHSLNGRPMKVNEARPKEQRSGGGGGGGYGGGRSGGGGGGRSGGGYRDR